MINYLKVIDFGGNLLTNLKNHDSFSESFNNLEKMSSCSFNMGIVVNLGSIALIIRRLFSAAPSVHPALTLHATIETPGGVQIANIIFPSKLLFIGFRFCELL